MTSKLTREERVQALYDLKVGQVLSQADIENVKMLSRMALAAMDSESEHLPLDYLQGHKDGLEWAAQLAEANHPETGDWLYDDPIELAKAIRKGPDMPPAQPVVESEPVAEVLSNRPGNDTSTIDRTLPVGTQLYRHAQQPVVIKGHQVRELVDSIHDIAVEHHDSQQLRRYIHNAVWSFIPHVLPGEKEVIPASSGECNDPHVWALNQMESILYIDNETPPEMRKGLVLATYLCRTLKSLIKNGAFEGKEISEQQLIKSIRDRK